MWHETISNLVGHVHAYVVRSINRVNLRTLFLSYKGEFVVKRQTVLLLIHPRKLSNQGGCLEAAGGSKAAAGHHPRTCGGQEARQAGPG